MQRPRRARKTRIHLIQVFDCDLVFTILSSLVRTSSCWKFSICEDGEL